MFLFVAGNANGQHVDVVWWHVAKMVMIVIGAVIASHTKPGFDTWKSVLFDFVFNTHACRTANDSLLIG